MTACKNPVISARRELSRGELLQLKGMYRCQLRVYPCFAFAPRGSVRCLRLRQSLLDGRSCTVDQSDGREQRERPMPQCKSICAARTRVAAAGDNDRSKLYRLSRRCSPATAPSSWTHWLLQQASGQCARFTCSCCRPLRTAASRLPLQLFTLPICVLTYGRATLPSHSCGREHHPRDLQPRGRPAWWLW